MSQRTRFIQRFKPSYIKCAVIGVILTAVLFFAYVFCSIAWFSTVDQKQKADAAIVLGAAAWYKRPSPVLEERVKHGLWLYKNHFVSKLIFTGGKSRNAPFSEAYVARRYALKQGVNINDIYIEERSSNTYGNLAYASEIMREHGLKSAIIVSDPLHMRRAMLIAEHLKLNAFSSPTPSTRYDSFGKKLKMLFNETMRLIGFCFIGDSSKASGN